MTAKTTKRRVKEKTLNRRAALQTLALGLGAVGLGRAIFACDDTNTNPPPRSTNGTGTPPTDQDEYVPADAGGPPVNAGDEAPKVPNQVWESRVKQLEAEQARIFRPEVFTMASPGIMAGKERSHVPVASVVDEAGKKRVIVVVQHVMGKNTLDAGAAVDAGYDAGKDAAVVKDAGPDGALDGGADAGDAGDAGKIDAATPTPIVDAGKPPEHYITTIYLRAVVNGADTVVGLWEFVSTDPAPPSVKFTLPEGVTTVVAFEWCTLHGLWSATPLPVT